jgi:hypothetical protein
MICTHDGPKHGWVRRLRVAAALVTLIAGIPGALATVILLAHFFWADPPTPTRRMESPSKAVQPGPGRCPPYHAFREGKCRDVRR